jgi:acyl-CoA thioester hydrolase
MAGALITFAGVAHPWFCDKMGHMNVRHYMAMFDDASFQLLGQVDGVPGQGWADVRYEIDYVHETSAGTLVTIRSYVEKVGRSSLTYVHVLADSLSGTVHAKARVVSVRFDLDERRKAEIEADRRARAEALMLPAASD